MPQHYTLEGRGLADDGLLERDAVDPVRAVHRSAAVERVRFAATKKKERKKTDNPREGSEDGTPPDYNIRNPFAS